METELDLGALGFWLFLAAVVVSSIISGAMRDRSLHRLVEASIEKSGTIDPKLAELLEMEIRRKAENDARMWGGGETRRKSVAARRKVAAAVAIAGGLFGIILFVGVLGSVLQNSDLDPILAVLIATGVGGVPTAFASLIAWVMWPKSEDSNDSEPLV